MEFITTLKTLLATISLVIASVFGLSTPTETPKIETGATIGQIATNTPETASTPPNSPLQDAYELGKSMGRIEATIDQIEKKVIEASTTPIILPSSAPVSQPEPIPAPNAPSPEPQPLPEQIIQPKSMSSLEIISPLNGKGLGRTYRAKLGIGEKGVSYDESNEIVLGLIVRNDAGDVVNNVVVEVSSTDQVQNKILNGTGNLGKQGYYYPYTYQFKNSGNHTITFTALGLTESVNLSVLEQSPEN